MISKCRISRTHNLPLRMTLNPGSGFLRAKITKQTP